MSSDEEIREVFEKEINQKTKEIFNRQGIVPFLGGKLQEMTVFELLPHLKALKKILNKGGCPKKRAGRLPLKSKSGGKRGK